MSVKWACMAYVDLNPVRAQLADSLEDSEFTSVYDRLTAERAQKRLKVAGQVVNPTQAQQALIERERVACKRADWLLDLNGSESLFGELDLEYYLSLVAASSYTASSEPQPEVRRLVEGAKQRLTAWEL